MLAEMTPAEMDERIAAEVIEEEKRNRIVETLKLVGAAICTALQLKVTPDDFEPDRRRVATSAPSDTAPASGGVSESGYVSPRQASAMMVGIMGRRPDRRRG